MYRRYSIIGGVLLVGVLGFLAACADQVSEQESSGVQVPVFEVNPLWPKPLPNHWVIGSTIGVSVDSRDHVFVIHRQSTIDAVSYTHLTLPTILLV